MPSPTAHDAFLSYNSLDHAIVERVAKELGTRQCRCFIDRWYLQPGRDWVEALERALSGSRSVVMFIGPREMGPWQQRERAWALDEFARRSDFPVIPVLLPGCEPPLGFMKQLMWIDLRNDPADSVQLDALAAAIRGETINRDGKPEPRAMICPYRGLLAFREEDADFFFGRQKYTDDLVKLVEQQSIVAVTGASGSGKSSVVRAGLVPRLRKRGEDPVWDILTMFPKENPLHSLADVFLPLVEPELSGIDLIRKRKALADDLEHSRVPLWDLVAEGLRQQKGTDRLLLVVDQWEELYTTCKNDTQRNRFIHELMDASSRTESPLKVVFTVRWDFYGEILKNRPLLDRLEQSRLDLGPMNPEELRCAIEGPGNKVGLTFQDGLVERILDDAGDEPGSLPLMEFVLEELWKHRRGDGQLTHEAYGKLGRLTGAIATRAETVFLELSVEEQTAAKSLFRRLVQAGAKTEEDTRRRADLSSLDATSQRVARKLAGERLLVTTGAVAVTNAVGDPLANGNSGLAGETVEVAHEELLRRWDQLKKWGDDDRQFLQWRSRLVPLLGEFSRDPKSALLRGHALRESRRYVPLRVAELDKHERAFVAASHNADWRRKQFVRSAAGALVCGALYALYVGYSVQQSNRRQATEKLVERLLKPAASTVEPNLQDLDEFRDLAVGQLRATVLDTERDFIHHVHAIYGLIQFDSASPGDLKLLLDGIPKLPNDEGENLFNALSHLLQNNDPMKLKEEIQKRIKNAANEQTKNRLVAVAVEIGITGADEITDVLKLQKDPSQRTSFIHSFSDFHGGLKQLADQLSEPKLAAETRSSLCIAVGRLGVDGKQATQAILKDLYQTAPDGGTHSAARWALIQQAVPEKELVKLIRERRQPGAEPAWEHFENVAGLTMIKIPSHEFKIGSETEDVGGGENSVFTGDPTESDESVPFPAIWISDREITVGQFENIMPKKFKDTLNQNTAEVPDPEHMPLAYVSWYDAIEFCNALSVKHKFKPFYTFSESEEIKRDEGGHIRVAKIVPERDDPHGYRLLTEVEWEDACRAMSAQGYCFGESTTFLPDYAVFNSSQTQICGHRIPNAWGLFDMHGNVWEWCWDSYDASGDSRVLRGGSFFDYDPQDLRSANRSNDWPGIRGNDVGFRISRTP